MKRTIALIVMVAMAGSGLTGIGAASVSAAAAVQINNSVVETFPKIPSPFNMMDWKQRALDYDSLVYDWTTATKDYATIFKDTSHYNMTSDTFKMPAYYGDERISTPYKISYDGVWTRRTNTSAYSGADRYSSAANAYAQLTFDGTTIQWIGGKGSNFGKADVYLDGVLDAAAIDLYNATALNQQVLYSRTGLSAGAHTIKVVAKGTKNASSSDYNIVIDAFMHDAPSNNNVDDAEMPAKFSGTWYTRADASFYRGSEHLTNTAGSYSEVTFTGTSVKWYGTAGANYGKADVYMDGVLDTSGVDTYSIETQVQKLMYSKSGLTNAVHTIKVVVTGTKNASSADSYVTIDRFECTSPVYNMDDSGSLVSYSGTWTPRSNAGAFNGTDRYSSVTSSYALYAFDGHSVKWFGGKGSNLGKADVYIDGVLDTAGIDAYNATGLDQQQLYSKTGLADGPHTLKVVVKGTKNASSSDYNIIIDKFETLTDLSRIENNDAPVHFSDSTWTSRPNTNAYNGTDAYSGTANSYAEYTFKGQTVQWIGGKGNNYGKADVYIDGVLDTANIDCYSASALDKQVLFSKSGLSNAQHTIRVVVKGTKNASSTDYNIVLDQFVSNHPYVNRDDTYNSDGEQDALTLMGSVIGASLLGIDKSNQGGYNYVNMLQSFYQTDYGIAEDNPRHGGLGSFTSLWYLLVPNILYYEIGDLYPSAANMTTIQRSIANKIYDMVNVLGGANADFAHQGFRFDTMTAYDGAWIEPDEAGAAAVIEYWAYKKFGDAKYLQAAKWSMDFLERINYNPIYEMGLDEAVYVAARLNADEGTNYNIEKYMNWKMQRTSDTRTDWGMNASSWYGNDVYGLGAGTGYNGYAFGMESWFAMKTYVPMVRYDPRFARAVGRWMLNMANNSWIFFADQWSAPHQSAPSYISKAEKVIPYEGLKKDFNGVQMYAAGDPTVNRDAWGLGANATDLALYSGSFMGYLGAMIKPTNDSKIFQFDTLKTDFYKGTAYPTYLYYNPYTISKSVQITLSAASDLYDEVSGAYLATNVSGTASFTIPADSSVVIVVAPAGSTLTTSGNKTYINGVFVSNATPAMTNVDQTSGSITYSGTWTNRTNANAYGGTDKYSSATGAYAQYTFTGTTVRWIGGQGANYGKADIYIDGVLDKANLDCYYATSKDQQVLYGKTGLSSGSHTIKIVVKGTKNASSSDYNIVVDAFQYS